MIFVTFLNEKTYEVTIYLSIYLFTFVYLSIYWYIFLYIYYIYIYRKTPVMTSFSIRLLAIRLKILLIDYSIADFFSWNLSIFPEHHFYRKLLGNCFWFPATFWTNCLLYQQKLNSATANCQGFPEPVVCKWSTVFAH